MAARRSQYGQETDEEALLTEEAVHGRTLTPRRAATILAILGVASVGAVLVGQKASVQRREERTKRHGHGADAIPDGGMLGLSGKLHGSVGKSNCNVTKSCAAPGMLCYEQNAMYAQCRPDCLPGPDITHWDGQPWSCKELGPRTPGKDACGVTGDDCRESKCCKLPGHQCYEKSKGWATCKAECIPGAPDFADTNNHTWSCKELGERTTGAQEWVKGQCASGFNDCVSVGCCKNAGEICYKQSDYFGMCKTSCPGGGWSCETVGYRTPGPPPKGAAMPEWAFDSCSAPETGCLKSRCCVGMDVQCYEKDETWAQCKSQCAPGRHADDHNASWSCKALGPRSYGVSRKGFPSLYCFSVIRTTGYEAPLMQAQYDKKAGIFGCDDVALFTADGTTTVGDIKSIQFPGAVITRSIDNTAGNTELFVHAWQAVIGANTWRNHTFTLKVDPDAVMIPDRVRWHLRPYVGDKMYVVNCDIGDMMYGALEAFSYHAILEWSNRYHECSAPNNWGEDKYMTICMDHLGVSRVHDLSIVADNLCHGAGDCTNGGAAAFHPFKDVGMWMQCWDKATAPPPAATVHVLQ